MDDEEYARRLFEILTRSPDADLPPGRLDSDWIDRSDGFGTDLRVTSVDVVPGEHGSQIDVGFVLEVPEGVDAPAVGSLLLPLDEEWRDVSGFAEPEDYAPRVAMHLMLNIYRHIRAHEPGPREDADLPSRDAQHAMLLEVLRREGEVEEQGPGRYVVRRRGSEDLDNLVVLLTAEEWEQALALRGTPQAGAFDSYEELFASTPREQRFLVFWEGDLAMSTREKLPPASVPWTPLREIKRTIAEAEASGAQHGWFAHRPDSQD